MQTWTGIQKNCSELRSGVFRCHYSYQSNSFICACQVSRT